MLSTVSCWSAKLHKKCEKHLYRMSKQPWPTVHFLWLADARHRVFLDGIRGVWNLTIDTTYNLGHFHVTLTTYPHLMSEDISTKNHPTMLGPVLVYQQMYFASFNYFGAIAGGLNKRLQNVRAFGTDGQESMIEAFSHYLPGALQLRCFIHFKNNVKVKLWHSITSSWKVCCWHFWKVLWE